MTLRLAAVAFAALVTPAQAASSPATLLARYQPVTVLHAAERFPPVAVEPFLSVAQLEQRTSDGTWTPLGPVTRLPSADPAGCTGACLRLDLPTCDAAVGVPSLACYAALQAAHPSRSVVYGAVLRPPGRIVLEYWYWYWYDFWSGEYPPTDYVWQAHEGDWEAVAVVLTRSGKPLLAAYSEHSCGKVRAWSRVPRWRGTTHPVAYVALGSHANYFSGGTHPFDLRKQCYLPIGAAILRRYLPAVLERTGGGARLGPARTAVFPVTAVSPTWMAFPGAWGEQNFLHAPEPIGTRNGGEAPTGPAFHALWRDPLGTIARWPRG